MIPYSLQLLLSSTIAVMGLSSMSTNFIVTGASGYLGRQIVHELIDYHHHQKQQKVDGRNYDVIQNEIVCLVREKNVNVEQSYWNDIITKSLSNGKCYDDSYIMKVKVMPYDMIDGGVTFSDALRYAFRGNDDSNAQSSCVVYHVASIFTPTENHYEMALHNIKGTEDLFYTIVNHNQRLPNNQQKQRIKVILTSSTAAVRGPNQAPLNNKYYTHKDWNTISELGKNWGHSYQWSKTMSERKAWKIAKEHDINMVSLCPSFIFGPPASNDGKSTSSSYSIQIVTSWLEGESPVQSRLCVDIRDVAKAHCLAGMLSNANGERLIVSSEARLSSQQVTKEFQRIAREVGFDNQEKIYADVQFDGGAVSIGKFMRIRKKKDQRNV